MKKKIFAIALCAVLLAGFAFSTPGVLTDSAISPCFIFEDIAEGY